MTPRTEGEEIVARAGKSTADRPSPPDTEPVRDAARCTGGQHCRMVLEVRLRVVLKAGGAANAPAALKLQDAFGRRICKRNEDVVPSTLKGGPARVDCISRGVSLSQRPAASRLDGPQ